MSETPGPEFSADWECYPGDPDVAGQPLLASAKYDQEAFERLARRRRQDPDSRLVRPDVMTDLWRPREHSLKHLALIPDLKYPGPQEAPVQHPGDMPVYKHGSPEWWDQLASSIDALASTYRGQSPWSGLMRGTLGLFARHARWQAAQRRRRTAGRR